MLRPGTYVHHHTKEYVEKSVFLGDIILKVKETRTAFSLTLEENQVRYDAPQIDAMFQKSNRVLIRKNGSNHAMSFISGCDDWFVLYPYRVGVPYSFELKK